MLNRERQPQVAQLVDRAPERRGVAGSTPAPTTRPTGAIVAIDATPLVAGNTGVARYTRELIAGLRDLGVDVRPFALGRGRGATPPGTTRVPVPLRLLQRSWRLTRLPRAEHLVRGVDLVHSTDLVPPPTRRPLVITVHDVLAVTRPDLHPPRAVAQQRAQLAALDSAAAVLAVSRATADDLVRLGVPATRIEVTGNGRTHLDDAEPIDGVHGEFVLAIGALHRRKGLDVLLRALADLPGVDAVLAGPDAGEGAALGQLAADLGVADRVRFLGAVTDGQLAWLYRSAAVLAFPSRAEGFGLPVLEAMDSGLPVVASDLGVLREVAGEAAWFVRPDDASALATTLHELLGDASSRAALSDAGRRRAAGFTWAATAEATAACYRRLAG
jgi:glycosyltransferase involved in cell wall biosynthesis